jgi:catechol 2,3-dioxygenase-like lactoylglutathione lyase family enzyme
VSEVLDHVAIRVSDLGASRAFYAAALAPLRFTVLYELGTEDAAGPGVAFGRTGADDFAIHEPIESAGRDAVTRGAHIAFRADSADAVAAFHAAAVANGGRSIGDARSAQRVQLGVLRGVRARPRRQQCRGRVARAILTVHAVAGCRG